MINGAAAASLANKRNKKKKNFLGLKSRHKSDNQLLKDQILTPEYGASKTLPGENSPKISTQRPSISATDRPGIESEIMRSDSILEKHLMAAVAPNTLPLGRRCFHCFF